jgi:hypothetical protein
MEFIPNIKYGTVEPQLRYVPIKNGFKSQSRRVERDLNGAITFISEWEDLGTSITFGEPKKPRSWWVKWLPF